VNEYRRARETAHAEEAAAAAREAPLPDSTA
jgi:hypothetical protein